MKLFGFVSAFPLSRRKNWATSEALTGLLKITQIKHRSTYSSCYPSALKTHKEPVAEAWLFTARYPASMGKPRGQARYVRQWVSPEDKKACSCFFCHLNSYEPPRPTACRCSVTVSSILQCCCSI